jgi:hypothetical protein
MLGQPGNPIDLCWPAATRGAAQLIEAAGRLELALASDGPLAAALQERFSASAEATLGVLAGLEAQSVQATSADGAEPACGATRVDQPLKGVDAATASAAVPLPPPGA